MRSLLAAGMLAAISVAFPAASPAQTVPNLSGTWVLQTDKAISG